MRKRGKIGPIPSSNNDGPDSPLEEDVASVIKGIGYPVDHQVGSTGFLIDLGVRDPERTSQYILAVECDGATYHSALWARERDRLRQEVLEHQGWRFHRIWSTDWFHRRENEIVRLRAALNKAREAAVRGYRPPTANSSSTSINSSHDTYQAVYDPLNTHGTQPEPPVSLKAPAYRKSDVTYVGNLAPHEVSEEQMKEIVIRIIEQEGPIHVKLVARRVAEAFGLSRTGRRIVEATYDGLKLAIRSIKQVTGNFVMTLEQAYKSPCEESFTGNSTGNHARLSAAYRNSRSCGMGRARKRRSTRSGTDPGGRSPLGISEGEFKVEFVHC